MSPNGRRFRNHLQAALTCAALLLGWICSKPLQLLAQSADEVHVSSRPYLPGEVFSSNSNLVSVGVVVKDRAGHAVSDLSKQDFEILDNGTPRPIAGFDVVQTSSAEPNQANSSPRESFVLFFDDVHGTAGNLRWAQVAAETFVKTQLPSGFDAAVFTASSGAGEFRSDRNSLLSAIEAVRMHPRGSEGEGDCPRLSAYQAMLIATQANTFEVDAAVQRLRTCSCPGAAFCAPQLVLEEMVKAKAEVIWQREQNIARDILAALQQAVAALARQPGNRRLIVASPGFFAAGLERDLDAIVDTAIRSNVVISGLDVRGLVATPLGGSFKESSGAPPPSNES